MNFEPRQPLSRRMARGARAGFTIVEVAVASFVLVFSLATTIVALQTGFRSLDVARGITLASQIAQSEIERMRLLNWEGSDGIASLPESAAIDVANIFTTDAKVAERFTVRREVARMEGDTRTNSDQIRQITIVVTWVTLDGVSHTRRFRTIYSKNGLYDYYHTIARS